MLNSLAALQLQTDASLHTLIVVDRPDAPTLDMIRYAAKLQV